MDNHSFIPPEFSNKAPGNAPVKNNTFAVLSLIVGIVSFIFFCFPPLQLILGGLSVILAALSKQGNRYEKTAIAGFAIGVFSCLFSFLFFWMVITTLEQAKNDPEYISAVNKVYDMYEGWLGTAR